VREPTTQDLTVNYGHFTSLQVRDLRVRGFELHLERLRSATLELYGVPLPDDVPARVLAALGDRVDATVRITVAGAEPTIMVTLRDPNPGRGPRRLMSVDYVRPLAHVKHIGTFPQIHFGRVAERAGFDDALLVAPDGLVTETTIANVGFFDGNSVVWPSAPMLHGTTMQLLESVVPSRREVIRLADLERFSGAFVTNSAGVSPVTAIDDHPFAIDERAMKALVDAYESVPWEPIA
jgi:branched-subunit amino acid aminotransferase/4-amino-4-deoxychorismate lyase